MVLGGGGCSYFGFFRQVAGAQIRAYLLEKSRITARNKGERSFHVFYMLLRF